MNFINPLCSICNIKMFRKCLYCLNYVCVNDHHNYICSKCHKSYHVKCEEYFKCTCTNDTNKN